MLFRSTLADTTKPNFPHKVHEGDIGVSGLGSSKTCTVDLIDLHFISNNLTSCWRNIIIRDISSLCFMEMEATHTINLWFCHVNV